MKTKKVYYNGRICKVEDSANGFIKLDYQNDWVAKSETSHWLTYYAYEFFDDAKFAAVVLLVCVGIVMSIFSFGVLLANVSGALINN